MFSSLLGLLQPLAIEKIELSRGANKQLTVTVKWRMWEEPVRQLVKDEKELFQKICDDLIRHDKDLWKHIEKIYGIEEEDDAAD